MKNMSMSLREKRFVSAACALALALLVTPGASAMHIMEGYLPPVDCVAWGVVCLPFLAWGLTTIRRLVRHQRKALLLLAMSGAFVFVISSLKIPSVSGSCSHMTGTGLAAILFGAPAAAVLGLIVLVFQALLLGHGGLTTLGANTFSMGIAGPLVSFGLYRLWRKLGLPRLAGVFAAAFAGDLITYCVTSIQLALANPSPEGGVAASAVAFLGVFAPTQLPLAVIEGILTMLVVLGLETYARPELRTIGYLKEA